MIKAMRIRKGGLQTSLAPFENRGYAMTGSRGVQDGRTFNDAHDVRSNRKSWDYPTKSLMSTETWLVWGICG